MSTWIYGLQAGGAAAIMWSWIIGGAGGWALAYSIAEIASAYPSSGAMYFTLKFLAPEEQVPFLCWIAGKFHVYDTLVSPMLLTRSEKRLSQSRGYRCRWCLYRICREPDASCSCFDYI